jgi:hypothetical protein
MRVWKYRMRPGVTELPIPEGARALCAREQFGEVCVWMLVDPAQTPVTRTFEIYGTDHQIVGTAAGLTYLGTAFLEGGALVFHVFERKRVGL